MASSDKQSRVDQVVDRFRTLVNDTYVLDEEVVKNMCEYVRQAEAAVPLPSGRRARPRASETAEGASDVTGSAVVKKPRNKSAYNVYVREMMQAENIKSMNHREKMGAIASLWKGLSETEREDYKTLASKENEAQEQAE